MLNHSNTKLLFTDQLEQAFKTFSAESILIFDQALLNNSNFLTNIKTHSAHYSVQGGEELKSVKHLPSHLESIFKIIHNAQIRKPTFVGIGGGSVSDFTGFIASIYQRGVAFDLVPTTWLAAVDSAHGGKNALNLESHKNQIGTFH